MSSFLAKNHLTFRNNHIIIESTTTFILVIIILVIIVIIAVLFLYNMHTIHEFFVGYIYHNSNDNKSGKGD